MSKIALDLSQFSHVKSDKNTTTLRHKQGHELTLAHKSLSPEYKKALEQLACGGSVKMNDGGKVPMPPPKDNTPERPKEERPIRNEYEREGGMSGALNNVKKELSKLVGYQQGGEVKKAEEEHPFVTAIKELPGDIASAIKNAPDNAQMMKKSVEDKMSGELEQYDRKAKGGRVKLADGTPEEPVNKEMAQKIHSPDSYGKLPPVDISQMSQEEIDNMPAAEPDQQVIDRQVQQAPREVAQASPQPEVKAIPTIQNPAQTSPEVPQQQVEIQKLYNSIVSGQSGNTLHQSYNRPWEVFGPNGEPPQSFDATAWQQAEQQIAKQQADAQNVEQQKVAKIQADNEVRQRAGLPPLAVPGMAEQAPGLPSDDLKDVPPAVPQASSMMPQEAQPSMNDPMNPEGMMQGYDQVQQKIQQAAESKQRAADTYTKEYNEAKAEAAKAVQDMRDGFIDPNKFWQSHSKIMTGIGMILAGFNPTNSPNAAIDFLKFQMGQDLEAQKANLGARNNVLNAALQRFGNVKDATEMTRILQNEAIQHQLISEASKSKSPLAQAEALRAANVFHADTIGMFQNWALRRAMMGLAQSGNDPDAVSQMIQYARMSGNSELAKDLEGRFIPGIGLAKIHVPEATRGQITAHKQLNDAASDLLAYSKKHTNLIPGTPEYNVGLLKAQNLQQLYREGRLGGVYKESEQPLMEKVINENPAGFFKHFNSIPKLQEIIKQNHRVDNILRQSYGLPMDQNLGGNEPVKGADGKMYVRQGNYMVPVQPSKGK